MTLTAILSCATKVAETNSTHGEPDAVGETDTAPGGSTIVAESETADTGQRAECPEVIPGCEHTAPCLNVGSLDAEAAATCCMIEGDLEVDGARLLETRFAALSCLQKVTGTIAIDGVEIAVVEFRNLRWVGEELRIERVNADNLNMPALTSVGHLIIESETLLDLSGLEQLESMPYAVIQGRSLQSLSGIERALSSTTGILYVQDVDNVADYTALVRLPPDMAGLHLQDVANQSIPELPIQSLIGLTVKDTDLDDISFLQGLRTLEFLMVDGNTSLTTLEALSAARMDADSLYILDNAALTSLDGLQGVTTVSENIDIWGNPNLESVRLDGLTQVGGRIWVSEVDNATEVYMPALAEVEGYFMWIGPDQLTDMTGLDALRRVGGTFWLTTDAHSLIGLGALEYTPHFLLQYNNSIRDLTGLDSLRVVDGAGLGLYQNRALVSTRGADALETARRLTLIGNPRLAELSFPSLTDVAFVHIEDNRSLPTCQIDRLQEQLAAYGSFPDFDVANNGTDDPTACD